MILRVTDGTTTIYLNGGTSSIYLAENYAPVAPELTTTEFVDTLRDGGEVTHVRYANVVESVTVSVAASTFATVQAAVQALETLFAQAHHRAKTGKGAAVYVEYRAADSGTVYRSELLHARMEPDRETASEGWIADSALRYVIAWQRRFYWEGERTELALENGNGGPTTGGLTIQNTTDATHFNYVELDGTAIGGVLPTPLEVRLYNSYNSATRASLVYVAENVFSAPTAFSHILEGEDADYVAGSAAATTSAISSNGEYQRATWAGDGFTRVFSWDLSTTVLGYTQGFWFRLLARVISVSSDARVKLRVTFATVTAVVETVDVALDDTIIQNLGVIQLPPWLAGETSLYTVRLDVYAQRTGGGTIDLDFVQVTALDGYRELRPSGYGTPYLSTLVDDGIGGSLYVLYGSSKAGYYVLRGTQINAFPGKDARLYFLADSHSGEFDIARTHSVRVYYRPRRLTV